MACKKMMIKQIKERLQSPGDIFVTSFQGMSVPEQETLRRKLKESDILLFIVKNRLAKRALNEAKREQLLPVLQGPSAIATGSTDCIATSKILIDFAKRNQNFKVLGAFVDQQLIDLDSIKGLASIPSKEVLMAQIVGQIKSPLQGLINTLSATIRNFVLILDKIRDKK